MSDSASPKIERKRQARGQARIKSLLEAAESVFARDGYHNATTNEISATAGVSPATLYQFFVNKDEIANALTVSYAEQLGQVHEAMDFESFAQLDLADMVSGLIDPMLNFHKTHPAFITLMHDAPLSKETIDAKHAIMEKFIAKLAAMLRLRNSAMEPAEAAWAAQFCMIVFKGFFGEINSSTGARKRRLTADFKAVLVSHLQRQLSNHK